MCKALRVRVLEGTAAGGYDGQPLKASCANSTGGLAPLALCRRLGNRTEGGRDENRAGRREGRAEGTGGREDGLKGTGGKRREGGTKKSPAAEAGLCMGSPSGSGLTYVNSGRREPDRRPTGSRTGPEGGRDENRAGDRREPDRKPPGRRVRNRDRQGREPGRRPEGTGPKTDRVENRAGGDEGGGVKAGT